MPKKRFSAEEIVTLLRQIEVLMVQGKSAPEACREEGISQQCNESTGARASSGKGFTEIQSRYCVAAST